jgi:hypothetical protein
VHSARLAVRTTFVALLVTGTGLTNRPAAPVLLAVAVVALAARSATRTARHYSNAATRAKVVVTVASG